MSPEPKEEQRVIVINPTYDPLAKNRFEYTVTESGEKYDTAHVFDGGKLTDERYLRWINEINAAGDDEEITESSRESGAKLWDDIIAHVEGFDGDFPDNWKELIPNSEKMTALTDLLAVAIVEPDVKTGGKRRFGAANDFQFIKTEALMNGEPIQQTHTLTATTIELEKKYARIQAKRFKQEQTKGLRRSAKIQYVPQDKRIAELYDEMAQSVSGFAGDVTPLRFKTTVIHYVFAPTLDAKK
jgi:hypothetical protein